MSDFTPHERTWQAQENIGWELKEKYAKAGRKIDQAGRDLKHELDQAKNYSLEDAWWIFKQEQTQAWKDMDKAWWDCKRDQVIAWMKEEDEKGWWEEKQRAELAWWDEKEQVWWDEKLENEREWSQEDEQDWWDRKLTQITAWREQEQKWWGVKHQKQKEEKRNKLDSGTGPHSH